MNLLVNADEVIRQCERVIAVLESKLPPNRHYFDFSAIRYIVEKQIVEKIPKYRSLDTVKNSKWLIKNVYNEQNKVIGYNLNCSNCGFFWREWLHAKVFKFCPNCGSRMDGDEE